MFAAHRTRRLRWAAVLVIATLAVPVGPLPGPGVRAVQASQQSAQVPPPSPQPGLTPGPAPQPPRPPEPEFVPGQLVVTFRVGVSEQRVREIVHGQDAEIIGAIPRLRTYVLRLPAGISPPQAAERFRRIPEVQAADPNYILRAAYHGAPPNQSSSTPNDPLFNRQWYLRNTGYNSVHSYQPTGNKGFADADIDWPEAVPHYGQGSPQVVIAVLDTGIWDQHPDLVGKVAAQQDCTVVSNSGCAGSNPNDQVGHGTHVAGIAAAQTNNGQYIAGVCPECRLANAKVLDNQAQGQLDWLIAGIDWAVNAAGARILNASLGGISTAGCPSVLQLVIDQITQQGAVFVAAAGNWSLNLNSSPVVFPAVCNNVVTVAAVTSRDELAMNFSNYGSNYVEVAAPGEGILSTVPAGVSANLVQAFSGTSMAAPIVSGAIGVLWTKIGLSTPASSVLNQLYQAADKIDGTLGYPGYGYLSNLWQYGRLNLCRALGGQQCDPPSPAPPVVAAPQCPAAMGSITIDVSTGAGVQAGQPDPRWALIQVPSATHNPGVQFGYSSPYPYPLYNYPAFATSPHTAWTAPVPSGSNWIHPHDTGANQSPTSWGFFKYRLRVNLPPGSYSGGMITGQWAADDKAKLYFNNVLLASATGFQFLSPLSASIPSTSILPGQVNELVIEVENSGGSVSGILLKATLTLTCQAPPPGTIVIQKQAVGGNGTFSFTASGAGLPPSFSITTAGGTGSQTFSPLAPGQYTVTEGATPGWVLTGLTCAAQGNSVINVSGQTAQINLAPGDTVTCTFTNTMPTADLGDAPDSTNHAGAQMLAYPGVPAKFPTVFDQNTGSPPGPKHLQPKAVAWLGNNVSLEDEADQGPDQDGVNNIQPSSGNADQDKEDDGLLSLILPACGENAGQVKVKVSSNQQSFKMYLNVWIDFNRDGDWDDDARCQLPSGQIIPVPEWAVRNRPINAPGVYTFSFNAMDAGKPVWIRVTLSEQPAPDPDGPGPQQPDGRGPANGYQYGETEDYLTGAICAQKLIPKFLHSGPWIPAGGWVVNIAGPGGSGILITSPSGPVCKTVLPGQYTVSEVVQQGWTPVGPASSTATVNPGQTQAVQFKNQLKAVPVPWPSPVPVEPPDQGGPDRGPGSPDRPEGPRR